MIERFVPTDLLPLIGAWARAIFRPGNFRRLSELGMSPPDQPLRTDAPRLTGQDPDFGGMDAWRVFAVAEGCYINSPTADRTVVVQVLRVSRARAQ